MNAPGEFLSAQLASGIQVVGQPMAGVESAAIGILIGTGARDEEPMHMGISRFVEQMLFRGTEHMDARALSDKLDALGVDYDSSAGLEMTLVSAVLIGNRLPQAIDLLTDVIRYPAFPEEAIANVRPLLLQERLQREDRPPQKAMDMLRQLFFAGSPLGVDTLGTPDTLEILERGDLVGYWSSRFTANNILISLAGNFDWESSLERLEGVTDGWQNGDGRTRLSPPQTHGGVHVVLRESAQENIAFAFPGISVNDSRYYAAAVLAQVLGGSSNSRLYQEVREKNGLAYAIQARFDGLESTGLYRVYVGTTPDRAHQSVELILQELRKLEQHGITHDELSLAKIRLKSQLIMRSESTYARMGANLRSWWFEQRLYTLEDISRRIDAVTIDDVDVLAAGLGITDHLLGVAIGPQTEEQLFGGLIARA